MIQSGPKMTQNGPKIPQMAQKLRPDLRTFSAIFLTEKAVPQTLSCKNLDIMSDVRPFMYDYVDYDSNHDYDHAYDGASQDYNDFDKMMTKL